MSTIVPLLPRGGAVVFDVGARFGAWTEALVRCAGPRLAKVFVFEPSPVNHEIISKFTSEKVVPVELAVSDRSGETTFFSDSPTSGLGSLHQRRLDHYRISHVPAGVIRTVTLDDYTREHGIERIDFLKLDIEGHELAALCGARNLLSSGSIGALSFEFGGCNIDSRTFFQDYWYFLREFEFDIFRIVPGARLLPVKGYSEDLETFRTTNYVAVPKSSAQYPR